MIACSSFEFPRYCPSVYSLVSLFPESPTLLLPLDGDSVGSTFEISLTPCQTPEPPWFAPVCGVTYHSDNNATLFDLDLDRIDGSDRIRAEFRNTTGLEGTEFAIFPAASVANTEDFDFLPFGQ
jgi:hypothetical protein